MPDRMIVIETAETRSVMLAQTSRYCERSADATNYSPLNCDRAIGRRDLGLFQDRRLDS